jgi:uncharacterized RDD family membrane protein YckC
MEQILDLPSTGQRPLNYAGFWIRVAAYLIDAVVLYAFFFVVMLAFGVSFTDPEAMNPSSMAIFYVILLVASVGYFVGMEASSSQATLGKMAVGIKVGNEKGERISVANAAGRFFSKIISGLILYIGYMMAGWDKKKQALHDKIAGTYVFYK